jgi:hypothetical protein
VSGENIAFLKNLTLQMIGDSPGSNRTLLHNLPPFGVVRTYKRCPIRYPNPFQPLMISGRSWPTKGTRSAWNARTDEAKLAA